MRIANRQFIECMKFIVYSLFAYYWGICSSLLRPHNRTLSLTLFYSLFPLHSVVFHSLSLLYVVYNTKPNEYGPSSVFVLGLYCCLASILQLLRQFDRILCLEYPQQRILLLIHWLIILFLLP